MDGTVTGARNVLRTSVQELPVRRGIRAEVLAEPKWTILPLPVPPSPDTVHDVMPQSALGLLRHSQGAAR
jgi:hypothetical protein